MSGEDAGNVNSVSGGRTNAIKMGDELSADGSVGEMSFHHTEFALSVVLPSIELNLLALYCLELTLMHLISVDVSNNTRVLEIYDGIVDEKSGGG